MQKKTCFFAESQQNKAEGHFYDYPRRQEESNIATSSYQMTTAVPLVATMSMEPLAPMVS